MQCHCGSHCSYEYMAGFASEQHEVHNECSVSINHCHRLPSIACHAGASSIKPQLTYCNGAGVTSSSWMVSSVAAVALAHALAMHQ
jgi:hypothetical protein